MLEKTSRRTWQKVPRGLSWIFLLSAVGCVTPTVADTSAPAVREITDVGESFRCAPFQRTGDAVVTVDTMLAGVPAILRVPRHISRPQIVLWHGFGAPASERALMEALPLDDVPAVKVYPGLPLFGARVSAGGNKELAR